MENNLEYALFTNRANMKLLILCIALIGGPAFAKTPTPQHSQSDKVTCPVGYQLVDGTYRIIKGQGAPQKAYIKNNTLIMEFPKHTKGRAIAVCGRIPL